MAGQSGNGRTTGAKEVITINIYLFNGIRDPTYERATVRVVKSLQQLRPDLHIHKNTSSSRGLENMVDAARNSRRDGDLLNIEDFGHHLLANAQIPQGEENYSLVLVGAGFHSDRIGSCHGQLRTSNEKKIVLISNYQKNTPSTFTDLVMHEIGHLLGAAADPHRSQVELNAGYHCINQGCVMQQYTAQRSADFRQARQESRLLPYCGQCVEDIIKES